MNTPDTNQTARGSSRATLIAVGVFALLGLAYAIIRVDILRARIASLEVRRDQQETLNGILRARSDDLMTANLATQDQLKHLATVESELSSLSASVGELRGRTDQSQRNWARIESLYLLRLANDQLQLAQDVPTAIAALEAAQTRLDAMRDTTLDGVRLQLAADISALRKVPVVDLHAITVQLTQAGQLANTLKVAATVVNASTNENASTPRQAGIARAWVVLKRSLAALFSVRKSSADATGLITSDEQMLQRHHLQLLLLSARQAAQLHDAGNYRNSLRDAQHWLSSAFDLRDKQVAVLNEQLGQWANQEIAPVLPDISGSRRLLERYTPTIAVNTP